MGTTTRGRGRQVVGGLVALALVVGSAACGRPNTDARPSATTIARVVAAAPATTTTVAKPAPPRAPRFTLRRTIDAAHPLKVALVGDSVAYSIIPTLQSVAQVFRDRYRLPFVAQGGFTGPGFGLTADVEGHNDIGPTAPTEPFIHWRESLDHMVATDDPDVVLVLLGIWDSIERVPGGRVLRPSMAAWRRWYEGIADDFVHRLTARGAAVVWLGMPCTGRADVNARLARVKAAQRSTRRIAPRRIAFVDLESVACENGTPIYHVPSMWGPLTVREADGVHFRPLEATPVLRPFLVRRFLSLLRESKALPAQPRQ
jgi:hypothetical protein